jgi:hypothetical protein
MIHDWSFGDKLYEPEVSRVVRDPTVSGGAVVGYGSDVAGIMMCVCRCVSRRVRLEQQPYTGFWMIKHIVINRPF